MYGNYGCKISKWSRKKNKNKKHQIGSILVFVLFFFLAEFHGDDNDNGNV